jgi:leucyl-tRNA synthetase
MSKRWYNVVNPDDVVEKFGADTLRMYEMFLGPLEMSKPWNTHGIDGVAKFLKKLWNLFHNAKGDVRISDEKPSADELKALHKAIKKVEDDIENLSFNTCVSEFMICVNTLSQLKCNKRSILNDLVIIMSPVAPHIAEELWQLLGYDTSVIYAKYPKFDPEAVKESSFEYPIMVNGKLRTKIPFSLDADQAMMKQAVIENETVKKWLEGNQPKKIIIVPKRIINVVV